MKKYATIMLVATITCLGIALAYLKGHRDGVKDSEVRSLSYEYYIYDKLERGDTNAGREQLAHLMAFRYRWVNEGISPLDGWSYWRHVKDWRDCGELQSKAEAIAKSSEEILSHDKAFQSFQNGGSFNYPQSEIGEANKPAHDNP